jgi:hypothetical protein
MATKKIKRFQEGGMSDKDRGLEASKDDKVGFFERLRMGNIDEEGSEAYNRFGAGRAKADRDMESEAAAMRAVDKSRASTAAPAAPVAPAAMPERDAMEEANAREPIPVPAGPRADQPRPGGKPRVNVQAAQPSRKKEMTVAEAKKQLKLGERPSSASVAKANAQLGMGGSDRNENYGNEGRGRALTKEQQFAKADAEARSPEGVAKRKKQEAEQGLERVTPETALLPGGGLKVLSAAAKKLAAPKMAKYSQEALPAPTKRLTYDKAGTVARKRAERAESRKSEMLKENAKRYGLDEDSPGYEAAAGAVRKGLGGKDFALKKGGSVKKAMPIKKMASGGSVSNPSKRADGAAIKGKTRCKMR